MRDTGVIDQNVQAPDAVKQTAHIRRISHISLKWETENAIRLFQFLCICFQRVFGMQAGQIQIITQFCQLSGDGAPDSPGSARDQCFSMFHSDEPPVNVCIQIFSYTVQLT